MKAQLNVALVKHILCSHEKRIWKTVNFSDGLLILWSELRSMRVNLYFKNIELASFSYFYIVLSLFWILTFWLYFIYLSFFCFLSKFYGFYQRSGTKTISERPTHTSSFTSAIWFSCDSCKIWSMVNLTIKPLFFIIAIWSSRDNFKICSMVKSHHKALFFLIAEYFALLSLRYTRITLLGILSDKALAVISKFLTVIDFYPNFICSLYCSASY